jgi:hypothetical protein
VWKPPPKLVISEWADQYGRLPAASSAESGQWASYPYQRAIMDAFCCPEVESVVCKKSKRVGWTKIIGHVVGYHIHQDPAPVLIVQPTIADADFAIPECLGAPGAERDLIALDARGRRVAVNLVEQHDAHRDAPKAGR